MQLRNARLCLDCEEVHDGPQCPVCASESLTFITRWVPAPERRAQPRPPQPVNAGDLDTYRRLLHPAPANRGWKFVTRGAIGVAILGATGWWLRKGRNTPGPPEPKS